MNFSASYKLSNLVTIVILQLFCTCSANAFFETRLKVYACNSEAQVKSCTACAREKDFFIQVEANVTAQSIVIKTYSGDSLVGSTAPNECKVVNKKNWSCGGRYEQVGDLGGYRTEEHGMNDGIYFRSYQSHNPGYVNPRFGINIKSSSFASFVCAK